MRWLLLSILLLGRGASAATTTAIVGVNVLPMTSAKVLADQTVIVEGGRIARIGPNATVRVPPDAVIVPGAGRWLIPGLTDAHVHLFSRPELSLYVANGVTAVFNLNGRPQHLLWRDEVRDGRIIGPAIYTAGPTFMSRLTREEAVKTVDEQAAAGYDAVKIYNQVGRDELGALAAEAKAKKLLVVGHVAREGGFEETLRAGVSIAHAEELVYTFFNTQHDETFEHIVFDETKIPEAARLTASAGVVVIPTISTFRDIVRQASDLDAYLRNPELDYLAPPLRAALGPGANRYDGRYSAAELEQLRRALPFQRKLVAAFAAAGVPLLAGTDATSIGPVAGFSIHDELAELVASGLTPFQSLQAGTIHAARYLRRSADYGTIEEGKRADLVLLGGDPLADIRNTRKIEGVMRDGTWLDAEALGAMLKSVPPAYERELQALAEELIADPCAAEARLAADDPFGMFGASALAAAAAGGTATELRALLMRIGELMPASRVISEDSLNELGYALLAASRIDQAIAAFEVNTTRHPGSANTFDSLAEAHSIGGDAAKAAELYAKALRIDPEYPNAAAARKFIDEHRTGLMPD